jgi:hypothetical protein
LLQFNDHNIELSVTKQDQQQEGQIAWLVLIIILIIIIIENRNKSLLLLLLLFGRVDNKGDTIIIISLVVG